MVFEADVRPGMAAPQRRISESALPSDLSEENRRLQRCLGDLVSVVALPAIWGDAQPVRVIQTSVEALLGVIDADFVYARGIDPSDETPVEEIRFAAGSDLSNRVQEVSEVLNGCLHDASQGWTEPTRRRIGDKEVAICMVCMGLHGDVGEMIAGSVRVDFPADAEKLLLRVAANQAAFGLQQTAVLNRQRQIARDLDERVAQRTAKLAAANEELRNEVAERRKTEEALRDKEQSFRLVVDGIAGLVAIMTPAGQLEMVNRQILDYFGKGVEQLQSWATTDVVHPQDRDRVTSAWANSIRTGSVYDVDHRLLRADGEYRWFHARGLPLQDADGLAVRWYVLLTDIHDRKEAEERLRRSEADLQEAQRLARLGSWKLDVLRGKVTVSPEIYRRYGVKPEEDSLSADFWFDRIHPDDRIRVREHFEKCLNEKTDYEDEYRILSWDGSVKYQHSLGRPILNDNGELIEFSGTTTEVTDQVQARLALQKAFGEIEKSERNLSLNINAMPTLLASARPDGCAEFFNERWRQYTGLSQEQLEGWGWTDPIHPDDAADLLRKWQSSLLSGVPLEAEVRMRRFDGIYQWLLFRANALRDQTGAIVKWYGNAVNIEDRKRAEEALQASERELRSIINTIPTLAWSTTSDGAADFLNQRWLDFTGLSSEQARGWGWSAAIHPVDFRGLAERWQSSLASGEPVEAEARMRRYDGSFRWFLFRASPLRDEFGNISRWYGTNIDIDDRKRAEDAVRASELSWRQIVDNIPGLVATLDANGAVEFMNRQILEYFGKSSRELKDWTMIGAIHPDDLSRVIAAHNKAIELGHVYESEHRLRRKDGVFRWFQIRGLPVRDEGGAITSWYLLLTDIDERKQAEEKLRRSEAFLAEGQRVARTGNFSVQIATDEIRFSEELYHIFDFDPAVPLTVEQIRDRVHPDDQSVFLENLGKARRGECEIENDLRILLPDGSIRYIHIVAHAGRDESTPDECVGTVQDFTERHCAEESLSKARAELAHVTRVTSLGVLTASIAHEVRQPLYGILLNASSCLQMLDADPPNIEGARETARRTIRDGNRASDVITRLRALYSRKEISLESVDLNETAREVIALFQAELQSNRVVLRQELAEGLSRVRGDRTQLQQVILNLLRNASDAMKALDGRPRQVLIWTEINPHDQVCLGVRDAGVGFDPQLADKLFDGFYTTKPDGMGIGLSVSRTIIEAHGGRIWAELNDGPGATFAFSLPPEVLLDQGAASSAAA